MNDGLIFDARGTGPGIHALVIGVGHYPHLIGGGGKTLENTEGMGQLSSAPASAQAFAAWLLGEMAHPRGLKLASLRLLVSARPAKAFKHQALPRPVKPEPADVETVARAITGWRTDLDGDEDSLGIFFFSGHGVSAGLTQGLLLSDLGANDGNEFDPAIKLEAFHLGMSRAKARQQVYFVDACRSHSAGFADTYGSGGRAFVTPNPNIRHSRPRAAPIFNATLRDEAALGVKNKPSLFTQALLQAFDGAGSDNTDDDAEWLVETATLSRGVEFLVAQASRKHGLAQDQVTPTDHASRVELHRLGKNPTVPVVASCIPELEKVEIVGVPSGRWTVGPDPQFLAAGAYSFTARAAGPPPVTGALNKTVRPPYSRLTFPLA